MKIATNKSTEQKKFFFLICKNKTLQTFNNLNSCSRISILNETPNINLSIHNNT